MSRPRKQRDSFVQSLFPFLAVLLSTMGALVLLLMLIVNQAQANAKQMALEKREQLEDAESKLEMLRDTFEEQLGERRLELERKRLALQHLEKHIQELIAEMKSLERTAQLLATKQTEDKSTQSENDQKITQLEKQLADAKVDLQKKLDNPVGNKPIFAIIPYQGTNGTHRRPIYLECNEKGVTIQPEGILIGLSDLRPPYGPGNPLDAAIRTVRSRFAPANGALTSTAYPLLVVRPSGVRTYAMARQAMSGWDDQFGYELVDESLELTYPESEPGIAAEVEQALVLARERQAALVMAMPAKYRNFIAQGGAPSSDSFDFTDDGGDLGDDWAGGGDDSSASGTSAGGGTSAGSGSGLGKGSGARGGRGGFASGNSGNGQSGLRSASGPGGSAAKSGNPANGGTGQVASNGGMPGQPGSGEFGFGDPTQNANGAAGDGNSYFANGSGGTPGDSYFGSGAMSGGPAGGQFNPTDSSRNTGGTSSNNGGGAGGAGGDYGAGDFADGGGGANGANGGGAGGGSFNGAGGSAGAGGQGGPGGALSGNSSTAPTGSGGAGAVSMNGMGAVASDPANDPTQPAGSPNQQPAPSVNMDMSRPAPPRRNSSTSEPGSQQSDPVARQRGRNWAWSEGPPTKTAVVRSIRVVCYNDRWVLMQDGSSSSQVTIPIGRNPQASAEKLAKAISDRVSDWGIALGGGYWKPELVVDVAPDAQSRYTQLERLLEGSGLTVRRRTSK